MIREVLNYKHGKLMSTNLHMTLPHTLYKQALEYVKERESKTSEFMKSISELHENSKRNLDEIIGGHDVENQSNVNQNVDMAKIEKRIETLESNIEKIQNTLVEMLQILKK